MTLRTRLCNYTTFSALLSQDADRDLHTSIRRGNAHLLRHKHETTALVDGPHHRILPHLSVVLCIVVRSLAKLLVQGPEVVSSAYISFPCINRHSLRGRLDPTLLRPKSLHCTLRVSGLCEHAWPPFPLGTISTSEWRARRSETREAQVGAAKLHTIAEGSLEPVVPSCMMNGCKELPGVLCATLPNTSYGGQLSLPSTT